SGPASNRGAGRHHLPLRPRLAVPVTEIRRRAAPPRHHRVHGPCRRRRRHRRAGTLLRPSTEERPEPTPVGHPSRTAPGNHPLDRTHLPPPQAPTPPRPHDPDRVRDRLRCQHPSPRGLTRRVNRSWGSPLLISRLLLPGTPAPRATCSTSATTRRCGVLS